MPAVRTSKWPLSLTSYRFAKQELPRKRSDALHRAIADLEPAPFAGLGSERHARVAPHLEQIMGQTPQPPFPTDFLQAAQQKPSETTSFFDLTKHRFHDDFSPCVQGTPCGGPHFRRHTLFRRGGRIGPLHHPGLMPLAFRGPIRIAPPDCRRLHRWLTVIHAVQPYPNALRRKHPR